MNPFSFRKAAEKRLPAISLFLFFLFSLIIIRFYQIQIFEGEKWERQAKMQHQFVISESFKRGAFYANTSLKKGHPEIAVPLAIDVSRFHLFIDPKSIPASSRGEIHKKIAALLTLTREETKKIGLHFAKTNSRSRKLVSWLDNKQKALIDEWWFPYARTKRIPSNALYFIEDFQRSHSYGKLLGQVLHTVREDRDDKTKQAIPTGGLELAFDSILQGKEGKRLLLRAPRYSLENDQMIIPPENGADITLTVNHILQAIAEEEIEKGVKKAEAKSGYALMMDPFTGEILALAQYPFFHLGEYPRYFNDAEKIEHTKVKAISDCNEPGSTFKPMTAILALIANEELQKHGKKPLFTIDEIIRTDNGYFPGRSKPVKDVGFHKKLNMYMAIQKSSNIYVATLAKRIVDTMGEKWYSEKLETLFGFGQKTGIEIPSESPGFLPIPGKKYANGHPQWSTPTPYSLAMGYNLLTTGVQMVRAYAMIVNGGYAVKPTIIKKISKAHPLEKEQILYESPPPSSKRIISKEICDEIMNTLKFSTKPGGCGTHASIGGYTEGGKSGTSEKFVGGAYSTKIHFSSFIGVAPAILPRFVLLVGVDEPVYRFIPGHGRTHFGGRASAPVFREIARRTLEYLGVTPDDPFGYPPGDPRSDPNKEHFSEETRKLKILYEKLNR